MADSERQDAAGPSEPTHGAPVPGGTLTVVIGVLATVAVLVVAGVLTLSGGEEPEQATFDADPPASLDDRVSPTAPSPLPDVELDGFGQAGTVRTSSYRGEPLVINFWATWCAPCVEEMPVLEEVSRDADAPAFLGVNLQDDLEDAQRLVADLGVTYDLAVDADGRLFEGVEGFGMPTTLIVDAEGTIRYRHTGPLEAEQLRGLLDEHLGRS